jgi:hypothetical protein
MAPFFQEEVALRLAAAVEARFGASRSPNLARA